MYAWLWHQLPGPLPVRVLCALLSVIAVLALLFLVVFPRVEPLLPFQDVTVSTGAGQPPARPAPGPAPAPVVA